MKEITNNEMKFILCILKNPGIEYNARSLSQMIGISHMGTFKIAKRLEKEEIVDSRLVGKARVYTLNFRNEYSFKYVKFLLEREARFSPPYVQVWIHKLNEIKNAKIIILFGSILTKYEKAGDIDVLFVLDENNLNKLEKEIEEINSISFKKIHPIFQTEKDLIDNINIRKDKVILNAIRGILVFGEGDLIKILKK